MVKALRNLVRKLRSLCSDDEIDSVSPPELVLEFRDKNRAVVRRRDNGRQEFFAFRYFDFNDDVVVLQGGFGDVRYYKKLEEIGDGRYRVVQFIL